MQEVNSSNITHIGYDEQSKTLKVRFKAGGQYNYHNVPKHEHDSLVNAKSIGAHFAKNIRNMYQFTKENP